jgi:hypothetical protein
LHSQQRRRSRKSCLLPHSRRGPCRKMRQRRTKQCRRGAVAKGRLHVQQRRSGRAYGPRKARGAPSPAPLFVNVTPKAPRR